jgi:microcystin degradation protein MlrC
MKEGMDMKIMICCFGQETNTFSPKRLSYEAFLPDGWCDSENLIQAYEYTRSYLGGAIDACRAEDVEIIPLDSIAIDGGALMTSECFETCMAHLCGQIGKHYREADGLFIAMHGAGSAEGVVDLEAETLRRIRAITGREFPIMSSLDIHCTITPQMLQLSDGLFSIKEFPHTDLAEAAALAVKTLIEAVRNNKRPFMDWCPLPMMLPNTTTSTLEKPMAQVRDYFREYCVQNGLLDATLIQGFSANDQYWAGASVLVVSWDAPCGHANNLARWFWDRKNEFDPHPNDACRALDMAEEYKGEGYVIVNESSDNPGSGCPGDGTHLLRELVKRDVPGSLFMFIVDPETAKQAHKAGIGARIHACIGGKTAPVCGEPVELDVQVVGLADGTFKYVTPQNYGVQVSIGPTARLRHSNVEIVVATECSQSFDDRPLWITGADIEDYRIVCIKSAGHFRAYFQSRAALLVPCEMPGLRSSDLRTYPYKYVRRPIYPLDEITQEEFENAIQQAY